MALTGRYDFRKTWTGKILLRVEEEVPGFFGKGQMKRRWRDANLMDLTARELRVLMDSRLRPLLMAQYAAPASASQKAAGPAQAPAAPAPSAAAGTSPAASPSPGAQMPPASPIASLDLLRKSRTAQSPPSER